MVFKPSKWHGGRAMMKKIGALHDTSHVPALHIHIDPVEYPRDRNQLVVNLKSSTGYALMEHIIAGMDIKDLCKKAIFKVKEMKLLKSELVERKVLNKSKILLSFSKNDMEYLNANAEGEKH